MSDDSTQPGGRTVKNSSGVDRRNFVGLAALGTALGFARPLIGDQSDLTPLPAQTKPPQSFELEEITVSELQRGLESGRFTAKSLTAAYLERIDAVDKRGPAINAIIEINPDAGSIAEELDRERKEGRVRGPLHGVPVVIKDNIDTADRMHTTAGSLALEQSVAARDAFLVRKLREAGAVIIGKTNLSEWANFRSTHSSSGWSARGGQTRNPYVIDRNPCGSSAGTGTAVSANLAAIGVGTETDGSIVCPSSASALVGIKPTLGFISRSGIIPISHSQDTAGPMARTVTDAAILLGALAGVDSLDSVTAGSHKKTSPDYTKFLERDGLKGARVGVARKYFGFNDRVDTLMNNAIDVMKKEGATIVDPADMVTAGKYDESEFEVLLFEFKAGINKYLSRLSPKVRTRNLADLIEFNEANREREMPYFGQEIFLKAEKKGPLSSPQYRKALARNHRLSRGQGIDATLARHRLDAMIAPTGGPVWPTDLINGDHYSGGYSTASAVSGYPHITVPAGFVLGLPVGISFFAGAWSEPKLIRLAYAFEQATRVRRAPRFLATAPLRE
ncbi:MAG TPA: amidase [Thermoanaerobaculia bacterium]|nr:amidase [Thermoanaerobaculia bacterium]